MVYARWIDPAVFAAVREAFFGGLPGPLRLALPWCARRGIRAQLHGHGMGRHSRDEICAIGCRDVDALADLLGSQPYFLGEEPSALDASAYAFLANILWVPIDVPPKARAQSRPNLGAYCERMRARFFAP